MPLSAPLSRSTSSHRGVGWAVLKADRPCEASESENCSGRMRCRNPLHWYIMTSPATDAATRQFFADKGNFGLLPEQIHFFQQVHGGHQ